MVYCFSCLPKSFCKEKASLRFAKLRNDKQGQKLRKTEQQREKNFFGALLHLKSKNSKHTPERKLYGAYCQNNSYQKVNVVIYLELFRQADRFCFLTACTN